MNKVILNQLTHFKRVNIPKYIESKIQMTALNHLNLTDMGKLRDRMEGQIYYSKLRTDIFSEFAFENLIGIRKFDWEKRSIKSYCEKNIASYSLPYAYGYRKELPKTLVGKVAYRKLLNDEEE